LSLDLQDPQQSSQFCCGCSACLLGVAVSSVYICVWMLRLRGLVSLHFCFWYLLPTPSSIAPVYMMFSLYFPELFTAQLRELGHLVYPGRCNYTGLTEHATRGTYISCSIHAPQLLCMHQRYQHHFSDTSKTELSYELFPAVSPLDIALFTSCTSHIDSYSLTIAP
jgi:hypothetical protein